MGQPGFPALVPRGAGSLPPGVGADLCPEAELRAAGRDQPAAGGPVEASYFAASELEKLPSVVLLVKVLLPRVMIVPLLFEMPLVLPAMVQLLATI